MVRLGSFDNTQGRERSNVSFSEISNISGMLDNYSIFQDYIMWHNSPGASSAPLWWNATWLDTVRQLILPYGWEDQYIYKFNSIQFNSQVHIVNFLDASVAVMAYIDRTFLKLWHSQIKESIHEKLKWYQWCRSWWWPRCGVSKMSSNSLLMLLQMYVSVIK